MAKKSVEIDGRTYDLRPQKESPQDLGITLPRVTVGRVMQILFICTVMLLLAANNMGCFGEQTQNAVTSTSASAMGNIALPKAEVIPARGGAIEHTHEANQIAGFAQRMNSPLEGIQILTISDTIHTARLVFTLQDVSISELNAKVKRRIRKFAK